MISGLGMDVIEIERIKAMLESHGDRFLNHVFTSHEQELAPVAELTRPVYYAGRWAAKEAVAKALGTGIGESCSWKDVEVDRTQEGMPFVTLRGRGAETARQKGIDTIKVTISHEGKLACSAAIGETSA